MHCDFNHCIDRLHTDSVKWCRYDEDVLPLWVADMDFASPQPVIQALQERVAHGVFGYGQAPDELREVVQERLARLYGWRVETDDIFFIPGVVSGFNLACRAIGAPGDEVLVEAPVYPPMLAGPEVDYSNRQLAERYGLLNRQACHVLTSVSSQFTQGDSAQVKDCRRS